jgi:hypothetical protein
MQCERLYHCTLPLLYSLRLSFHRRWNLSVDYDNAFNRKGFTTLLSHFLHSLRLSFHRRWNLSVDDRNVCIVKGFTTLLSSFHSFALLFHSVCLSFHRRWNLSVDYDNDCKAQGRYAISTLMLYHSALCLLTPKHNRKAITLTHPESPAPRASLIYLKIPASRDNTFLPGWPLVFLPAQYLFLYPP